MATLTLSPETNLVFPTINQVYHTNFYSFEKEESKDFSISFLSKQIDFIKIELRNKALEKKDKLRLLNLLNELNEILENLTERQDTNFQLPSNLNEYPAYNLHKKSQSAFSRLE